MGFDLNAYFKDINFIYCLTAAMLSIGTLISSLEDLISWPVFQTKGLLSWNVSKLISKSFVESPFSKFLNFILQDKVFKASFYLRIICSILVFLFAVFGIVSPLLIIPLFLASILVALRSPYGLNGAYQMHLVILLSLSIGCIFGPNSSISSLCLWFIAAELLLAYFISGFAKLASPVWRQSMALKGIFSTHCFGHSTIYRLVSKNDLFTVAMSWTVFCFEMLFTAILFFSPTYAIFFLSIGFLFHLSNAIFMGLNDFLFAFSAAYPALLYCVIFLHQSR